MSIFLKIENTCGNNLVNIVITLANEALMHIRDPPADSLGKWWESGNVFRCFLFLLLSYIMFVFKDKSLLTLIAALN